VGLLDDFISIPFWVKLACQVLAALLLIKMGMQVNMVKSGFPGLSKEVAQGLDIAVTLLWLVGMTNAFNFVDSMDGLATGIAAITCLFLAFAGLFSEQLSLAHFMALMTGLCYGLYIYNSIPALFFLGDAGALTIGFILAATSMLYNPRIFSQASSWFVPVMVLGIPIFDVVLVVISRLRRAKPIYQADRGHTYHRLIARGISPQRAILMMHAASVLLGCFAFIAMNQNPYLSNAIFAVVIIVAITLVLILDNRKQWPD